MLTSNHTFWLTPLHVIHRSRASSLHPLLKALRIPFLMGVRQRHQAGLRKASLQRQRVRKLSAQTVFARLVKLSQARSHRPSA